MKLRLSTLLALPLSLALSMTACGDDDNTGGGEEESESGSETDGGDGDGDDESDSDEGGTDSATTTTTTTDETDTDECSIGAEGCPCTNGGSCDAGLMCEDGTCVPADPATGDGDGDDPSGDGDGDSGGDGDGDTAGDGDGDTTTGGACEGEEFIQIEAVDADYEGWGPVMSMLGEGEILAWDEQSQDAFVSFDIDVPCDDDWTIWVRAINQGQNDSFFATVDGGPDPAAIFEIACDQGPQQATYEWNDLNWRDQDGGGPCDYVEDPWIQTWDAGQHNLTLSYRESYAITRIWVTNTDQMPPDP